MTRGLVKTRDIRVNNFSSISTNSFLILIQKSRHHDDISAQEFQHEIDNNALALSFV